MLKKVELPRIYAGRVCKANLTACALIGLFVCALSEPAYAECLPERMLVVDTHGVDAFGTTRHFKPLPLSANEYVLTFDDGPNAKTTQSLLRTLKDACVHASFFMVGKHAEKDPADVRAIVAAEHTVGSHSYDHVDLTKLPLDDAEAEIKRGKEAVERAAGSSQSGPVVDRLFRFPDNYETPELIAAARTLGLTVASYDISPEDWRGTPPEETLARLRIALNHADRGVIVMHDGQPNTVLLLPMVFSELRMRHARIVHLLPR